MHVSRVVCRAIYLFAGRRGWSVDGCRFWVTVAVTVRPGVSRARSWSEVSDSEQTTRQRQRRLALQSRHQQPTIVASVAAPSDDTALDWTHQYQHEITASCWRSYAVALLDQRLHHWQDAASVLAHRLDTYYYRHVRTNTHDDSTHRPDHAYKALYVCQNPQCISAVFTARQHSLLCRALY